jgi:hypothetical protein
MKYILVCFLIYSSYAYTYPDCSAALSIHEYKKLTTENQYRTVHPYLQKAFCNLENREKYTKLFLDLFEEKSKISSRLDHLSYLLYQSNMKTNGTSFFEFLGELLNQIELKDKDIAKGIHFTNLKFTYLRYNSGVKEACNFLDDQTRFFGKTLPNSIKSYNFFLKRSKCADSHNDYNSSIFYLMQALKVAQNLDYPKNRLKTGHVLKSLSSSYYTLKDYENSEIYADSAIGIFLPEFKHKIGLAVSYEFKALTHYQLQKEAETAMEYFQKAQSIYKKADNSSRYHFVERLKAKVHLEKNPQLATESLINSINYFYTNKRKIHHAPGLLLAHSIMQRYQLQNLKSENGTAFSHVQVIDSLTGLLAVENLKNKLKINSALVDYYSRLPNNDSVLKYSLMQNNYQKISNQLSIEEKQANVDLYLTNYDKKQKLATLNIINEEHSYQIKLLSTSICFVLISLMSYYIYKRKQKQVLITKLQLKETHYHKLLTEHRLKENLMRSKEKDEDILKLAYDNEVKRKQVLQLQLKQKQLEVEAAKLEKQSSEKLLGEVLSALKDKNVNDASHLIKKLQTNEVITKFNNSLKGLLESISPHFMSALEEITPNLTEQDILYCVLLRQKYNTKEISTYLNISPKSVNQHKYRLKKKLFIAKEQTLNEFISNIDKTI